MPIPTSPGRHPPRDALAGRLVAFGAALRGHGLAVGSADIADAGRAAEALGFEDRDRLREAFAATLLRRGGQRRVYDDLFDVFFPAAVGARMGLGDDSLDATPTDAAARREIAARLREELAGALARGDASALDRLAAEVVARLGRLPNQATLGAYSAGQALDTLNPQTAIADAESLARGQNVGQGAGAAGGGTGMAARFSRDELRAEVAAFRRRVETETRRRNAEVRGTERISRYAVRSPAEQTSFVLAGPDELHELRRAIGPLSRKLATRLAARRRLGRGAPIDMRRTLRRAMGTGGVSMRPAFQRHTKSRIDLVLICDLSSSVAGFSRFTILLMQAMSAQFRRVRIFGFVNVIDDLTDTILRAAPGADLTKEFADTSRMTRWHTNSDYGSALTDFADHHLDAVGHRSVVLILGDARTNHTYPGLDALHAINERAKAVIWLNPEPARQWNSGDSVAHAYAEVVDMHECRNLAQLRAFVTRQLPV
ncbi:MAG: VWA domain-containing protein [Dermatophilaceae bacterium]